MKIRGTAIGNTDFDYETLYLRYIKCNFFHYIYFSGALGRIQETNKVS